MAEDQLSRIRVVDGGHRRRAGESEAASARQGMPDADRPQAADRRTRTAAVLAILFVLASAMGGGIATWFGLSAALR